MKTVLMITCAAVALSGCVAGTQTVPAPPRAPVEVTPLPSPPLEAPKQPGAPVGDQTDQETPEEEDSLVWDLILGTRPEPLPEIVAYYDFRNEIRSHLGTYYQYNAGSLSSTVDMEGIWYTEPPQGQTQRVGEVDLELDFGSNSISGDISNVFETVFESSCLQVPSRCTAPITRKYDGTLSVTGGINHTAGGGSTFSWAISPQTLTDSKNPSHTMRVDAANAGVVGSFMFPRAQPSNITMFGGGGVYLTVNGAPGPTQNHRLEATRY